MLRALILKFSAKPWVERFVRHSFLFRGIVKRFIGGDNLAEGMATAQPLLDSGFLVSLDLLGESVASEAEAVAAKEAYLAMIRALSGDPHFRPMQLCDRPDRRLCEPESINISIKLTQCGFDISDELAERHYREVLDQARSVGTFVRVDMESSAYTERTVALMERLVPEYPEAGTVLQSYLRRTPDDLARLNAVHCRIRLVKGAYLEPETVAFAGKAEVDQAYLELARTMLQETNYPAFATHDEKLVDSINAYAKAEGIDRSRYEFQMLYGIRRDLQNRLLGEGYRVRVYIPFGDSWYPYFTRRLAERPANLWFILKSIFRG